MYVEKEKAVPLVYKDIKMEIGYRIDFLVNDTLILEIKAVDKLNKIHLAQVLTYLKLTHLKLGLLLNFNVSKLTDGIKRVINSWEKRTAETTDDAQRAQRLIKKKLSVFSVLK